MNIENIIQNASMVLFFIFIIVFVLKVIILLVKDKVNVYVAGRGRKDRKTMIVEWFMKIATLSWVSIWFVKIFYATNIKFKNLYLSSIGIFLIIVGIILLVLAMYFMKDSWRVGIDKNTKTTLIKEGIYKFSRNPAFVGLDLMFVGVFLIYQDIFTFIPMILSIISIHLLILREEAHLISEFGDEYKEYMKTTPRYFWFL